MDLVTYALLKNRGGGDSSSQYKITLTCPGWTQFETPDAENPTYEWFPAIKLEIIAPKAALDEVFEEVYNYTTDFQPIIQQQGLEYPVLHFQSNNDLINWYDTIKSDNFPHEGPEGFMTLGILTHIILKLSYAGYGTFYKFSSYEAQYDDNSYPIRDSNNNVVYNIVDKKYTVIDMGVLPSKYYIDINNPNYCLTWDNYLTMRVLNNNNNNQSAVEIVEIEYTFNKYSPDTGEPNEDLDINAAATFCIGLLADSTLTITKA